MWFGEVSIGEVSFGEVWCTDNMYGVTLGAVKPVRLTQMLLLCC